MTLATTIDTVTDKTLYVAATIGRAIDDICDYLKPEVSKREQRKAKRQARKDKRQAKRLERKAKRLERYQQELEPTEANYIVIDSPVIIEPSEIPVITVQSIPETTEENVNDDEPVKHSFDSSERVLGESYDPEFYQQLDKAFYESFTVDKLKAMAKDRGLIIKSKIKKSELVQLLSNA